MLTDNSQTLIGPFVTTIDGFTFDASQEVWDVPTAARRCRFDLSLLPRATPELVGNFKRMLVDRLVDGELPENAIKDLSRFRQLLRSIPGTECIQWLREADYHAYAAGLPDGSQFLAGHMLDMLRAWNATGTCGLAPCLVEALPLIERVDNVVGAAVKTMSLASGVLTVDEEARLAQALHDAHRNSVIPLGDYVACLLSIALYTRPLQIAAAKNRDLDLNGLSPCMRVTRLKQGAGIRPRELFATRELIPSLAAILERQRDASAAWASANGVPVHDAPLLPTHFQRRHKAPTLPGFCGHFTGEQLRARITSTLDGLAVPRDADGHSLHVTATRLRRTCATRAAEEGRSPATIARILDHSSEKTRVAYVQRTPLLIAAMDAALGEPVRDLAAAFRGTPVIGATYGGLIRKGDVK